MNSENKVCRTCLGEGVRHIFQPYLYDDTWCSGASINFIDDKLRYVLMLPVSENDGLPMWICELCLVQLNLAYNFKRVATESVEQHSAREITNAITYDVAVPDDTTQINPTIKQDPVLDGFHLQFAGASPPPPSEGSAFPRIISVVSYSQDCRNGPNSGVSSPSPNYEGGLVILKTDPADPVKDAAFIQSFRDTSPLIDSKNSTPSRAPQQAKATTTQQNRRKSSSSSSIKRKGKTERRLTDTLKEENKPDNINQQPTDARDPKSIAPSEANGKKPARRLSTIGQKITTVLRQLDIDMVMKSKFPESSLMLESSDLPIAKKVKLRRNSIHVPSYRH